MKKDGKKHPKITQDQIFFAGPAISLGAPLSCPTAFATHSLKFY